jgi:hypothetical protein
MDESAAERPRRDFGRDAMKFVLKLLAVIILGPIVLALLIVLAAAAVVAGPMLIDKVKDLMGSGAGPNTGPQTV